MYTILLASTTGGLLMQAITPLAAHDMLSGLKQELPLYLARPRPVPPPSTSRTWTLSLRKLWMLHAGALLSIHLLLELL